MTVTTDFETIVIGGGVVGMSLGFGLARAGERVCVLDEGDDAFRSARGNFGLVWVQGKGAADPNYARWSMQAARSWAAFATELCDHTGVDVQLAQDGGFNLCLDHDEMSARRSLLEGMRDQLDGDYPFEVMDHDAVRGMMPQIGPDVVGGTFGPLDGHVNPLRVLRALVQAFQSLGGTLLPGGRVDRIDHRPTGFHVCVGGRTHVAAKLVLAAGLGNRTLAPLVGLQAPVSPRRGQILVTERGQPTLRFPTGLVRQTGDGGVQIGDSNEDVGLDDGTTVDELSRIAERAGRLFPFLNGVNIVRSWGALRVMSPDGMPIYQQSLTCPGAFVVTCHSGITLASQHAGALAQWIHGGSEPMAIRTFKAERFDVQAH